MNIFDRLLADGWRDLGETDFFFRFYCRKKILLYDKAAKCWKDGETLAEVSINKILDLEWHVAAKRYLERLGREEHAQQLAAHLKRRRRESTFRYCPSEYHRELIRCLEEDDEERFKAIKGEWGYASGEDMKKLTQKQETA